MNNCPKCSAKTNSVDKFCGQCGYELEIQPGTQSMTQDDLKLENVQYNLGIIYLKMKKYQEALDIFQNLLEDDPDNLKVKSKVDQILSEKNYN